ncbi:DEAD/DEAH box helicase family protein [Bacillus sp. FJAT-29814]|uniref:DEAD/DEAH box helicase family protein n=1 Tax=Bacillus sp. FJAT-29814 TaxID=1729688 RepID=UPI00082C4DC6|nr:DEAD/DEAH box helicase family protein [Bacillus sp. FJAT-29814]
MYKKPLIIHEYSGLFYLLDWLDEDEKLKEKLITFSNLLKAPEEVSTFELTPYSLWTAAAKGITDDEIISFLHENTQNEMTESFQLKIKKNIREFGLLEFHSDRDYVVLTGRNNEIITFIKGIEGIDIRAIDEDERSITFPYWEKAEIKKILFKYDLFVKDVTKKVSDVFDFNVLSKDTYGNEIELFEYQKEAVKSFIKYHQYAGGGGTIIMPPNSGKTLVALSIIERLKTTTLIVTENDSSIERWIVELEEKSDYPQEKIGLISDTSVEQQPITIGTYEDVVKNLNSIGEFGIVIYDDAHKLPAENYEQAINVRSSYKIALTSTLARADNNGNRVFALVGPKWFEILPKTLRKLGFQVPVHCFEIKIPLTELEKEKYSRAKDDSERRNIAAKNESKKIALEYILQKRPGDRTLIVSYRLPLADFYGEYLDLPVITSNISPNEIQRLNVAWNDKSIQNMITASLMIEKKQLKEIDTMISISYQKGSRREEYLRIGKLLPSENQKQDAHFFSLVTSNTIEEKDYFRRKRSLINYGFLFRIITLEQLLDGGEDI